MGTSIFLIVSFLLHLITIFAIVVLYQRRALERVNLPSMQDDVETIHQSIEAFVDELEKENEVLYEKLLQHIKKKEKDWEERLQKIEEKYSALDMESSIEPENTSIQDFSVKESEQVEKLQHNNKDPKYQQALELHNQGFSADQIANVLKIGKGEASLIVNMIGKYRQQQK